MLQDIVYSTSTWVKLNVFGYIKNMHLGMKGALSYPYSGRFDEYILREPLVLTSFSERSK